MTGLTTRAGAAIGVPGRSASELRAGLPGRQWQVPDHHQSEFNTDHLEVRAATSRGLMHRHLGSSRQDEYSVTWHPESGTLLVVVCDGVGQYSESQQMAAWICADLPDYYAANGQLAEAVRSLNVSLISARARHAMEGAATVMAAAIRADEAALHVDWVCVGDSSGWLLNPATASWTCFTEQQEDGLLHDTAVHPLPDGAFGEPAHGTFTTTHPLFLMTDGVSGPLSRSEEVARTLSQWWAEPPHIFELAHQVAFARKSHNDDRTVVGIWPTGQNRVEI